MEITKKASTTSDGRKFIELKSRAGVAYIEYSAYPKKWGARFKLASGFNAQNIDWAIDLITESKRILQNPDAEWQEIIETV